MNSTRRQLLQRKVRSPRSAAISGILYSLLIMTIHIVLGSGSIVDPAEIDRDWLEARSAAATWILVLAPFAGLCFLWFTGVMRDLLGELEDKFFATVFLGSGIIVVVLTFVWAATYAAVFSTYKLVGDALTDLDVFIYVQAFSNELTNYFLRIAAVYMLSSSMLWIRTKVAPRWLSTVTIIVGLSFLLFAQELVLARFLFPAWVLMVSIFILIRNFRRNKDREDDEEPAFAARTFGKQAGETVAGHAPKGEADIGQSEPLNEKENRESAK